MGETPFNTAICEGSICILWTVIYAYNFGCAMITKLFLQDVDDFGRVALASWEVAYLDYLGIDINKDEVIHTIQCENF